MGKFTVATEATRIPPYSIYHTNGLLLMNGFMIEIILLHYYVHHKLNERKDESFSAHD